MRWQEGSSQLMRVTLINLWPTGGMLHYATALGNALVRRNGLELAMVLPETADATRLDAAIERHAIPLDLQPGKQHLLANLAQLARLDRFVAALRASRPDILHLNSSHPWLIPTARWLAARWPLVATVHDVDPHPGEDGLRRRLQGRAVLKHATAIAVHGQDLRAAVLKRCPWRRPEDVVVTPHGTYTFFGAAPAVPPDRPTVLFFGRIVAYKGLDVLLQAAPMVRQAIPSVRFVVAGEGDLAPYGALLEDESLVEVHPRYVPEAAVGDLFRDASILALPYKEASWSGVASIAHAFGLPVVATSVGCLPEAVQNGVNGVVIPPDDVESLAKALVAMLGDRHFYERLRRGAQASPGQSWDQAAATLCRLYKRLRR